MSADERRRQQAAARQAAKRRRDTLGLGLYRTTLPVDELALFLITAGAITGVAALDHDAVERALQNYLRQIIFRHGVTVAPRSLEGE